jgi:hypothetical protein
VGREHERARHEEDGLRSAQLAHEPAGRLTGRARDEPQGDMPDDVALSLRATVAG